MTNVLKNPGLVPAKSSGVKPTIISKPAVSNKSTTPNASARSEPISRVPSSMRAQFTTLKPPPDSPVRASPLERILAIGLTGSGKSYNWMKLAQRLRHTDTIFRVIDTDNAIDYMLQTQFPELLPQNGGHVYVCKAFSWDEFEFATIWLNQKGLTKTELDEVDPYLKIAYTTKIKPWDWAIVDMADNAWSRVQDYFAGEVFGKGGVGGHLLDIRKQVETKGGVGKDGKTVASIAKEAGDGWKDWPVMNKLYDDFMLPIIYRVPCHVYLTTKAEEIDKTEKDSEIKMLFGQYGVKPGGQKRIGHQSHTIFLMVPGKNRWSINTLKDRAKRPYFVKTEIVDFYNQYLFAKAGWGFIPREKVAEVESGLEELDENGISLSEGEQNGDNAADNAENAGADNGPEEGKTEEGGGG